MPKLVSLIFFLCRGFMSDISAVQFSEEWKSSVDLYSSEIREFAKQLVLKNKQELAMHFYQSMLTDANAKLFLSHEIVESRLKSSLQRWLEKLFSVVSEHDFLELVELQKQVGDVHARIDLPVHLVLKGARLIKEKIAEHLSEDCGDQIFLHQMAFKFISDSLDRAMELMSQAYAISYDRKSRAEESYRLFSAISNSAAEKGRQQSALLDWENQLLYNLTTMDAFDSIKSISKSDFGLWFMHKGLHAFGDLIETGLILNSINKIDELINLLPEQKSLVPLLKEIRAESRSIRMNLDDLFNRYNEVESGRDDLTRLLSRKYLSVVLSKETAYARKRGISFALLSIDLDYFKTINDTYGHAAGDLVLQQFSELLSNSCRAGDYVFRLGGEEFLILLVDVKEGSAMRIANQLKNKINSEKFIIDLPIDVKLTASIGLVIFDGHPDYNVLLKRADKALYKAKESGRNRIVFLENN